MKQHSYWGITAIAHVLLVRNVDISRYFYCNLLRFTVASNVRSQTSNETMECILDYPKGENVRSVGMLRLVKCPVRHTLVPAWNLTDDQNMFDLTLYVDNFNRFILEFEERLREMNLNLNPINIEQSPFNGVWCCDPDNYKVCILSNSWEEMGQIRGQEQ